MVGGAFAHHLESLGKSGKVTAAPEAFFPDWLNGVIELPRQLTSFVSYRTNDLTQMEDQVRQTGWHVTAPLTEKVTEAGAEWGRFQGADVYLSRNIHTIRTKNPRGWVTLGQITAAVLYAEALTGPLDRLVGEIDRLQVGVASTSRLLGIAQVPPDRVPGDRRPDGPDLVGVDLRFAYGEGHDVLHGINPELRTGERLAMVGPSGSGKSTLGRLLAGINRPRTGSVRIGGAELTELPLELLRTEIALVTQEHHVFVGSVRDNILLAREKSDDDTVWAALAAVGSADWVRRLPAGLPRAAHRVPRRAGPRRGHPPARGPQPASGARR